MPQTPRKPLAGSHVVHRRGSSRHAPLPGEHRIQVTVVLHPSDDTAHHQRSTHLAHPATRPALHGNALVQRYDPGEDAIERVRNFARQHDLDVIDASRVRHDVILEGSAGDIGRAFGVTLHEYAHDGGRYYGHDEAIHLPHELHDIVDGVLGLDNVPVHTPRLAAANGNRTYTAAELEKHYAFPAHDALGSSIALLQFGGGYDDADLQLFAQRYGVKLPIIRVHELAGAHGEQARNAPLPRKRMTALAQAWRNATDFRAFAQQAGSDMNAFMACMEVCMDIELAVALGGGADLEVYFAPQGADGWRRAIYAALGEPYPGSPAAPARLPAVISISWGESESAFKPADLRIIHKALVAAEAKGVAVCCSSGDRGSSNAFQPVTQANVNFPASSPAAIAVGGTRLTDAGEEAWKGSLLGAPVASGGGMSGFFDRPAWQDGPAFGIAQGTWTADGRAKKAGRWLPDVAANAAFESGVEIIVGGEQLSGGGTSAAAPIWAALLTRASAALGHHLAGLHPWLYQHVRRNGCDAVTGGDNDVMHGAIASYQATGDWNACTGLGRPDGNRLLQALLQTAPADAPTTQRRHPREELTA